MHDHPGAEILLFDKRAWKRMQHAFGKAMRKRAEANRGRTRIGKRLAEAAKLYAGRP